MFQLVPSHFVSLSAATSSGLSERSQSTRTSRQMRHLVRGSMAPAKGVVCLSTALRKSGIGSATAEINRGGGLGGLSERSVNLGQHLGERLRAPLEGVGVLVPLGDEGH